MRSIQPFRSRRELAPFGGSMRNLMSRFDDIFRDFEQDLSLPRPSPWTAQPMEALAEFNPLVDIEENDEMYLVSTDLPGLKKEDIKIDVSGNNLKISGERRREVKEEGYYERSAGRFMRSFTLPEHVDAKRIEANFEDGVLRIVLPKTEVKATGQEIKIQTGQPQGLIDRFLHREKTVKSGAEKGKH